jgi:hypothetical protein
MHSLLVCVLLCTNAAPAPTVPLPKGVVARYSLRTRAAVTTSRSIAKLAVVCKHAGLPNTANTAQDSARWGWVVVSGWLRDRTRTDDLWVMTGQNTSPPLLLDDLRTCWSTYCLPLPLIVPGPGTGNQLYSKSESLGKPEAVATKSTSSFGVTA